MDQKETKKAFFKLGCAGALNQVINREFGTLLEEEERATTPLCGGMMQQGYQCGMLWGASLAVGTEAYRRYGCNGEAISQAVTATRGILESFIHRAGTPNCGEITGCNQSRVTGVAKYLLTGGPRLCSGLGADWVPEAIQTSREGMSLSPVKTSFKSVSCASELARKMGASEQETAMVAGFAGGLGLSGNACGALAAAAWLKILPRTRNGKSLFFTPESRKTLRAFKKETDSEILCHNICGKPFDSMDDHSEYILGGGCEKLMQLISQS